jgi:hypothetical protein
MTDIQLTFFFRHGQSAECSYIRVQETCRKLDRMATQNTVAVHSKCNCICSQCRAALLTPLLTDHIVYCYYRPRQCRHVSTYWYCYLHTLCVFIHIWTASSRSTAAFQKHFASCGLVILPVAIPCQPFPYQNPCTYIRQREVPRPSV